MGFRDFSKCRIFSENGLWQWHEKPGYSGPAIVRRTTLMTAKALIVAPLMERT
jgi:hypothetical protein